MIRENARWIILGIAFVLGMAVFALFPRYHVNEARIVDRWTGNVVKDFSNEWSYRHRR